MLGKKADAEKGQNKALLRGGRHWSLEHAVELPGDAFPWIPHLLHPPLAPVVITWPAYSGAMLWGMWAGNWSWEVAALMTSGAGGVIWLFSQHQNLPRKGGELLFFTRFVSHLSDLASIVFCVFSQLKISIACWNIKLQCHTKCIVTQTAATIPGLWREGFNKGNLTSWWPGGSAPQVLQLCFPAELAPTTHFSCSCPVWTWSKATELPPTSDNSPILSTPTPWLH